MRQKLSNGYKLDVGIRLFVASVILWLVGVLFAQPMVAMIFAAIAMKFPGFKFNPRYLFEGPALTEEQKKAQDEFLKTIKTQNENQLKEFKTEFSELATKAKAGLITKEEFDKELQKITGKLEKFDADKFEKFETKLKEMEEAALKQGEFIKKLKDGDPEIEGGARKSLGKALDEIFQTDNFKEFQKDPKRSCSFELKTVSITDNYTGSTSILLTNRSPRIIDHPNFTRLNIRDLLSVETTDLPYIAFLEVYDWVRNVKLHTENERLAESSFKVREATSDIKRIGTHVVISKRMLKSLPFLRAHLTKQIPAMVKYFEDFMLLFGDGLGSNPSGVGKVADDFATVINTILTGGAGSVTSNFL